MLRIIICLFFHSFIFHSFHSSGARERIILKAQWKRIPTSTYFKDLKNFLTYHFNKTPWNETKLANVLEYCWRIGEEEVVDIEDENIKTLFELRPIHFIYYFEFLVFETENVMAGAKPTGYRSNSLLAYKRSTSFTCHCQYFDMYLSFSIRNKNLMPSSNRSNKLRS